MKKALFLGITALLALVIMSCDGLVGGPTDVAEADTFEAGKLWTSADGTEMIDLSISVDGGSDRALTATLAKAGVDFYEAVFYDGTANYYRTEWHKAETGKISLPVATYGTANNILFAGTMSDKTLLAIGKMTTPASIVASDTKSIIFTLEPITTDIKNTKDSTFLITSAGYATAAVYNTGTLPTVMAEGNPIPLFKIPADSTNALSTDGGVVKATYLFRLTTIANWASVYVKDGGTKTLKSTGLSSLNSADLPVEVAPVYTNTGAFSDGVINIEITTALGVSGLSKMYMDIPVAALGLTVPNGLLWHLRGGLGNHNLDAGVGNGGTIPASVGGAVLLGVGTLKSDAIIVSSTGL